MQPDEVQKGQEANERKKKWEWAPSCLDQNERDYYLTTWGFDPVSDCINMGELGFRYEEFFILKSDPLLHNAGVLICARVEWHKQKISNRIVFRREDAEAAVNCTHTVVFAGSASSILTFAEDTLTMKNQMSKINRAFVEQGGGTVKLPPWEHFCALKSYVAAITEIGIQSILLLVHSNSENSEYSSLPFGFNAEMQMQALNALNDVAPIPSRAILRDWTVELVDKTSPSWLKARRNLLSEIINLKALIISLGVPSLSEWVVSNKKKLDALFGSHNDGILQELALLCEKFEIEPVNERLGKVRVSILPKIQILVNFRDFPVPPVLSLPPEFAKLLGNPKDVLLSLKQWDKTKTFHVVIVVEELRNYAECMAGIKLRISRQLAANLCDNSRECHPHVFEAFLSIRGGVLGEGILASRLRSSNAHAVFPPHHLVTDPPIIACALSHPSGDVFPSAADLHLIAAGTKNFLLIIACPYDSTTMRAYDRQGSAIPVEIVDNIPIEVPAEFQNMLDNLRDGEFEEDDDNE